MSLFDHGPGWSDLVTFLKGEPAWDPAACRVIALPSDMVKIRGSQGVTGCCFYDEGLKGCRIYEHRPVECRALRCWDTREIEEMFLENMLSRRDICADRPDIIAMMDEYDSLFGVDSMLSMLGKYGTPDHPGVAGFMEKASGYRQNALHILGAGEDTGDFLFGREIKEIMDRLVAAGRYA